MRLTYVLPRPELSGGNKVALQHAGLLRRLRHEVTVVGEGPPPDWIRVEAPYRDSTAGVPDLPRQDLVIATYWTTLDRARELDLGPVVHFCQGYEGHLEHLAPSLARIEEVYSRPHPALTVSPHLADLLARRFGKESRVVPPPVDPLFRPRPRLLPSRPRSPWVAVPGIFEAAVKNVPTALRAVRDLRERGLPVRLLRLSTLPLSSEERAILEPDRYLESVPPARIARELRRCHLLLFASREGEGFGLPVLEAMASGVPVVASRIPSVEAFAGGVVELVAPGGAVALADAAHSLLGCPRAWRRSRRAGLRRARRFRPRRIARELDAAVRWARDAAR